MRSDWKWNWYRNVAWKKKDKIAKFRLRQRSRKKGNKLCERNKFWRNDEILYFSISHLNYSRHRIYISLKIMSYFCLVSENSIPIRSNCIQCNGNDTQQKSNNKGKNKISKAITCSNAIRIVVYDSKTIQKLNNILIRAHC